MIYLETPLTVDKIKQLKAGDEVFLSGTIYTGRDAAHKRLIQLLDEGKELPFNIQDQTIFYVGPTPSKPGQVFGSGGPTTSGRMVAYSPRLIKLGITCDDWIKGIEVMQLKKPLLTIMAFILVLLVVLER